MARDQLPTGLLRRAAATGRIAAEVGRAAARRVVRASIDDDRAFGEALFGELDQLKGMAMKVGQILSYLEVGLPDETVARLAQLQRGVEPLVFAAIAAELERELGAPLPSLFDAFDQRPIAAASVGQVHRATLRGAPVAVKVRYPGVRESLGADVRQLEWIGRLASLGTSVDGPALVAELRDRLLEECDYRNEATTTERFGSFFTGDPQIHVPAVHRDRSAGGVLTTSWCEGEPAEALAAASPARRAAVAVTAARFPWTTLFRHGWLHADPHPGNFLFPADDQLVVLDFGCARQVPAAEVNTLAALVDAVLDGHRARAVEAARAVGLVPHPERIDVDELWALLDFLFAPYREERFRFDRQWWTTSMRRFSGPRAANARWLGFPPSWLWIQRTLLGLHAVLMRLEVEAPLAAVARGALAGPRVAE
ncbi:MAG: AarF/UbiB family protein [Myxococcota bacterium]